MESLNFPPVEFFRPDCSDNGAVFQEFAIVLHNLQLFESIPTIKWLTLLQEKAFIRQKVNLVEADRLQHLSEQLASNDELDKAMLYITQALFRCPPNTNLQKAVLCQKGELLRRKDRMQDAARHLEQCLRIEGERFSFSTYRCLLRCYKSMGNGRKVRTTLGRFASFFNKWKTEFQRYDSQLKNEPDAHMEEMKKEFDLHGDCIPNEIANDKSFRNEPTVQDSYEEEVDVEPFNGFSPDIKISGASSACNLDIEDKSPKLMANTLIPENSVVLVERPLASHLEFSKVQCYTCHVVNPHLIPCFTCHSVFYCTYQCQEADYDYHKYECRGYLLLFFPLVNGNLELRMLIRTLCALQQTVATKKNYKSPRTANELYKLLLEGRENFVDVSNALLTRLDYSNFRMEDFDALMIKTEKLLSYVKFDRQIGTEFFTGFKDVDEFQLEIFIGGLLLHFCTLTMTKVHRLSFEIPATEDFVGRVLAEYNANGLAEEEKSLKQIMLDSLERYGNKRSTVIDTAFLRQKILKHLDSLRTHHLSSRDITDQDMDPNNQVWTRKNVKQLWQKCLDKAKFDCTRQQEHMNVASNRWEREEDLVLRALPHFVDAYFEFFGEIPVCSKDRTFPNMLRAFYPTAAKLKHSCGPNTFYAMISNGLFVARARHNITEGEELTLNHGLHYKEAPREVRRNYLRKIYINCDCIECGRIEDHWIRYRRVKCEDCLFNASAPQTCPKCLQSKEIPWEVDCLIQQLQDIESNLSKNNLPQPQLMSLTALGRAAGGLQTATASGKRKVEVLIFFERIWQMLFVDASSVPLYNNLKEQLSCFAEEVVRDNVDGVYELLKRCRSVIDTLFPHMSIQVANEYELVVRRAIKYMLPAKFLHCDMRQVHRTIDLARSMIKHAFVILEAHFLYDDESFHKLTVVQDQLVSFEDNIRRTEAQDQSVLFLGISYNKKEQQQQQQQQQKNQQDQPKPRKERKERKQTDKLIKLTKNIGDNETNVVVDLKPQTKTVLLKEVAQSKDTPAASSNNTASNDNCKKLTITNAKQKGDQEEQNVSTAQDNEVPPQDKAECSGSGTSSNNGRRKDTGAIPKPNRTTKHHRKV